MGCGAIAVVAVGLTLHARDGTLGTAAPPFVAGWGPRAEAAGLAVALAGAIAAWRGSPAIPRLRHPAVALYGLALLTGLSVNVARHGTAGWTQAFAGSREAANEYLPGLPALSYGVHFYLDRFAELVPSQPVNVAGHPPGPLLLVHLLGIDTAAGLAVLCVGAGALSAPLTWRLARTLGAARDVAATAGVLCALSPLSVLFGVTSFDYFFAALGAAAACGLAAQRRAARLAGAGLLGLAALMSWALLAVGAWATVLVWRRDGLRPALALAALCAVAVAGLDAVLAVGWGYDPVGTLRATEQVYRHSLAMRRPYAYWVLGSPVAWGLMLGAPILAGWLGATARGRPEAVALAVVIAVASIAGFTKAETERIWLFLVPLACAAAAPLVGPRRLRLATFALLAQALLVEVLMDTVW